MCRRPLQTPWILLALLVCAPRMASAQVPTGSFHGILKVGRGSGSIDRNPDDSIPDGNSILKVPGWRWQLSPDTNGIDPATEQVTLQVNDTTFMPLGMLRASRNGRVFSYRVPQPEAPPALRSFRISRRKDGSYTVRFTVTGIDLRSLTLRDPVCYPFTIVVGDDDGFAEAYVTSPSFDSRHLAFAGACPVCDPVHQGHHC